MNDLNMQIESAVNKMNTLGIKLSKATMTDIHGVLVEIAEQYNVIDDLVHERIERGYGEDEVEDFLIYDECLKVTLITSTENAWRILDETKCQAVEEVDDVYENKQDEIHDIILTAIDCIHEIALEQYKEECSSVCLGWGKDACETHSCKYLGDIQEAYRMDEVWNKGIWKVISIEYVGDC